MKKVDLYTDGACSGNPGPGGWAAILVCGEAERELSGGDINTTNNRMELTAVIEGLSVLKYSCSVTLYSDSKYVIDALRLGWAEGWKSRGWVKSNREKALNPDLWEKLLELISMHELNYVWVKGHDGHSYNERCDRLAVEQSEKHRGKIND